MPELCPPSTSLSERLYAARSWLLGLEEGGKLERALTEESLVGDRLATVHAFGYKGYDPQGAGHARRRPRHADAQFNLSSGTFTFNSYVMTGTLNDVVGSMRQLYLDGANWSPNPMFLGASR